MLFKIAVFTVVFFSLNASAYFRYLVLHSQSTQTPSCSDLPVGGWSTVWSGGYSLLGTWIDPNWGAPQNLGSIGSCAETFVPANSLECKKANCDFQTAGDLTAWLATNNLADFNLNITNAANLTTVKDRVSRCTVCSGKKPVLVKHSYSGSPPACPGGWTELWVGYSLAMVGYDAGRVSGQDLGDTGSCLKTFDPAPQISCWDDNCRRDNSPSAIWLLNHDTASDKTSKSPGDSTANKGRIGQCRVCVKN